MTELNANHLLCFVIIAMILYYIMGSCGCGFRVGGPGTCTGIGRDKDGKSYSCKEKYTERGGDNIGQNACIPRGESGCMYMFNNVGSGSGFRVGANMNNEELEAGLREARMGAEDLEWRLHNLLRADVFEDRRRAAAAAAAAAATEPLR
jgi:hypothetical protein